MKAREGATWLCQACGVTHVDREALYMRGCGTWAVEVMLDSIQRNEQGRVIKATLAGEIHKVEITGKVVV